MPITLPQAVNLLRTETRRFLETYPIVISGFPAASGPKTYFISDALGGGLRGGTILKTLTRHETQKFRIWTVAPGNHPVDAHHIQMVASTAVPIALHAVPLNAGPDLMFTGGLSGCSFIVNTQGNSIACAHLQPINETGAALHTRLTNLHAYTVVYGRNDYDHVNAQGGNDRQVSIVGVRRNNQWKVYAQKNEMVAGTHMIRKVKRIYPL